MIKKTILLLFLIGITTVQAQSAKSLLDEVSKKVKGYTNIVISFKYALNNPAENVSQETRGDVTLQGNKYLLSLMGTQRMYDGKKIYVIIPEDEEINISSQDEDDDNSITPSKMLTFYEEGYSYKMDMVQDLNGRKIQFIKLTPIDSKSDLKEILLGIDKQTKHIYKMVQKLNNGTNVTFTVNSFKTNQPISETLFKFDESKYENYYINRLD